MVHRGPDSAGYRELSFAAIGMRRLRIIDVTVDGDQPISNEDGSVWVVMNGEIYNFVALRDELTARGHVFRSLTDTEVIVHLWEELGPGLVARLRGMFAFAVVDERRRTVFLARDRLGIKPPAPGGTVRALRENGPGARAPNPQTLRSRSAGTARPARMGANHGHAAPQNPRGLRSLPRQHPREANRVKHGIVAGEPGDQKWSRRVREGGLGKGPQGTSPRPYLSRPNRGEIAGGQGALPGRLPGLRRVRQRAQRQGRRLRVLQGVPPGRDRAPVDAPARARCDVRMASPLWTAAVVLRLVAYARASAWRRAARATQHRRLAIRRRRDRRLRKLEDRTDGGLEPDRPG